MRAFLFLVLVLAAASIGACSLVTSLDGYSGTERVVFVVAEGGSDSSSGTSGTSGSSGTSGDVHDSGTDAPAGVLCPSGAFCASFDRVGMPDEGWTRLIRSTGARMGLTTVHRSAGHALRVELPAAPADYAAAVVEREAPATGKMHGRVRVAYRLDAASDRNTNLLTLKRRGEAAYAELVLSVQDREVGLDEIAHTGAKQNRAAFVWPLGRWVEVQIDVDLVDRRAVLQLDGVAVITAPITFDWNQPTSLLSIGAHGGESAVPHVVLIDDVIVEETP